jgi:hypothetical protein
MGPWAGGADVVEPEEPRSLAWWWTVVYAANLPMFVTLGVVITGKAGGLAGMLAAMVVGWLVGLAACYQLPRATEAVTVGAMYVAMLQIFPVLHFGAAVIAVITWHQATGTSPVEVPGWRAELGVFTVTLTTGLILTLFAWVFGRGPRLLFAPTVARTPDEADYIDDGAEPTRDP